MTEKRRSILKVLCDTANPFSWITATRNWLFDHGLIKSHEYTIPTICIGNITVGGTGKTPHTEYIARMLKGGFKVAVLSRGYGRQSKGYILADANTPIHQIGDEPFQIKNKFKEIRVAVCEKRATGIARLISEQKDTEVILLDDAFQHRYVKAGLNILLIDSTRPIWRDCILPFGRMRESANGIRRADIVIITKCDELTDKQKDFCRNYVARIKEIPIFFSCIEYGEPYPLFNCSTTRMTKATDVLLVTGIARPEPMVKEIERMGAKVTLRSFADHHNFTSSDLKEIEQQYNNIENNNKVIITTEKDATRILGNENIPETIKSNTLVLPIEVDILNDKNMFNKIILDYVTENSRNRRIP